MMVVEHHHFKLNDPLLRAVHVEVHPDYAIIEYYLSLPRLEPTKTECGSQTMFTASHGENFLSIDLQNKDMRIVFRVGPEIAVQAIRTYETISTKHTTSLADD